MGDAVTSGGVGRVVADRETGPEDRAPSRKGEDCEAASLAEYVHQLETELAAVRRSERRYRLLADSTSDMVSIHGLDGLFSFVSASAGSVLGYDPAELIGFEPSDFVHPDDQGLLRGAGMAMLRTRTVQHCELRARRKDGAYVLVEADFGPVLEPDGKMTEFWAALRDVSARAAAEERFRLALEEAPIGMAVVDVSGRWQAVNQALADLTGWTPDELLSLSFQEITHPDDLEHDLEAARDLLAGRIKRYGTDKRFLRPDKSPIWVHLSVSLARDASDEPLYYICHVQDVSAQREAERELTNMALTDPLTGVANRRLLHDRLTQARLRQGRAGGEIALIFVDLDSLKSVNDCFGHSAGDVLLQETSTRLTVAVRDGDTVARYGGDEFVVVCSLGDSSQFAPLLSRLRKVCDGPVVIAGESVPLVASVGGVLIDERETLAQALARADQAMYSEKLSRRRLT